MESMKLILFVLALSAIDYGSGIIMETSDGNELENLAEAAIATLLSCYETQVVTVGSVGVSERVLQKILFKQSIAVSLIGDHTERVAASDQAVSKPLRHKLQLFVVGASSPQQLHQNLQRVKSSQWWNHMATYLIIDWPSQKTQLDCSNAYGYLWAAWDMNLINALYVCLNTSERKVLVYSYNPYTSQAPKPWRFENTYEGKKGHPWTLLVREYRQGEPKSCTNLNFVKTHDLGGYEIDCFMQSSQRVANLTMHRAQEILDHIKYPGYIFEAFKATPRLTLFFQYQTHVSLAQVGNTTTIRKNSVDNLFDILLSPVRDPNAVKRGATLSSRFLSGGLAVLTHHSGEMSQLNKIITLLDKTTRFGLCLIVIKTLLFFKYFMRQPIGTAVLNVFRIITYSTLVKVPRKVAPRLYLAGVFFLVVTIVGIYQGKIASLLTKPVPLPDVETMQDLIDSPHKIHVHYDLVKFFTHPKFNGRLVIHREVGFKCIDYVTIDPLFACIDSRVFLVDLALSLKLHLSRDTLVPMDLVYWIRRDWPLEERLNEIIARLSESHIAWFLVLRNSQLRSEIATYYVNLERNRRCKVMNLSELGFAFAILGIGLGLATVSFIVEVAFKRVCSRST